VFHNFRQLLLSPTHYKCILLDSLIITLNDFRVFVYDVVDVYTVCSK